MTFQQLIHHACTRPQMYGKTFLDVAQFLNGYDAGYTAALKHSDPDAEPEIVGLSRFRQWLAVKMGGSQCRCWQTIIEETFPDDETRLQQTILLFDEFTGSKEQTRRQEPEPALVAYVDVDDTFVRTYGTKRIAMPSVITHIRRLKAQGAELYCWSSGGAEYARASAAEFGLTECFVAFLPKPQVLLDDQEIGQWRSLLQVGPGEGQGVEEYRRRLQQSATQSAEDQDTTVEEQVGYGLDTVDEGRTVEVPLRDLMFVNQTLALLVNFFHQRAHWPDVEAVQRFLGDKHAGALHLLWECYYKRLRDIWPEDIAEGYDEGRYDNPKPPRYYVPRSGTE